MSYLKQAKNLSQTQAIDNLNAVINSNHFKSYEFYPRQNNIHSDIININSIGGFKYGTIQSETFKQFKVEDLSDTITTILNTIENKGSLQHIFITLRPSEERLRAMNFEEKLYEEDFSLPISFGILKDGDYDLNKYAFNISNWGFKDNYFESEGLDLKDAKQKLNIWYDELTANFKKVLPHQVQNINHK
ncbi:MAG: hypothetical protein ACMXX9_03215 [Candidatus Woesearchaeota archaeon]